MRTSTVSLIIAKTGSYHDNEYRSWDQVPIQGQCQRRKLWNIGRMFVTESHRALSIVVAHDSMLPELGPESNTPMNVQEQSDAWIQRHLNEEERELLYGDSDPLYETHLTACTLIPNSDEQHPAGSPYHELEDGTAILD